MAMPSTGSPAHPVFLGAEPGVVFFDGPPVDQDYDLILGAGFFNSFPSMYNDSCFLQL